VGRSKGDRGGKVWRATWGNEQVVHAKLDESSMAGGGEVEKQIQGKS
jgi:hypothetical protein